MNQTPTNLRRDLSFEDYRRLPAVNWSLLKHMQDSPAHFKHHRDNPDHTSSPAQILGQITHKAILEPDAFEESVAVWTGGRRAGKAYKEWEEANAGKLLTREQDLDDVFAMQAAVRAHPVASRLLLKGEAEVTVEWTDEATGIPCKGRLDWLTIYDDHIVIVDLKTTRSTCPRRFPSDCARYGYHGQGAHYSAGARAVFDLPVTYVILAVEKTAPWDVAVYELDNGIPDGALYVGRNLRDELMAQLADCIKHDHWPGRHQGVQSLCLPTWALLDTDDLINFGSEE